MKNDKKSSVTNKISHFFKHYFGLLLLAIVCGVLTVLLISYCA